MFRLADKDKDFILSDEEMNNLHITVYNSELSVADLDGIKQVVYTHSSNGIVEDGLTFEGFVAA